MLFKETGYLSTGMQASHSRYLICGHANDDGVTQKSYKCRSRVPTNLSRII